jgi:hypothetical protein
MFAKMSFSLSLSLSYTHTHTTYIHTPPSNSTLTYSAHNILSGPFNFCLGVRKDHLVRQGIIRFKDRHDEESKIHGENDEPTSDDNAHSSQFREICMTKDKELKTWLSSRVCFIDLDVAYSNVPFRASTQQLGWGMRAIIKRMNGEVDTTSVIPSNLRRRVLDAFGVSYKEEIPSLVRKYASSTADIDNTNEDISLEDDMEDGEDTIETVCDFDLRDMLEYVSRQSSVCFVDVDLSMLESLSLSSSSKSKITSYYNNYL